MSKRFLPVRLALLACCGAMLGLPAVAQQSHEPFNYSTANNDADDTSDGDVLNNTGGTGFNGGWTGSNVTNVVNILSPSLSYPGVQTSGNRLRLDATPDNASRSVTRVLDRVYDTGTVYFSFLAQRNNTSKRSFNVAFFNGTSERFSAGQTGTSTLIGTDGAWGIGLQGTTSIITSNTPVAVNTGLIHFIVGRVDFNVNGNDDRIRLYVNPSLDGEPLTPYIDFTATTTGTPNFDLAFDRVRPFVGNNSGTQPNDYSAVSADFDEIRLGSSYSSVVPEPSSALMGVLAGGLLWGRRRRS